MRAVRLQRCVQAMHQVLPATCRAMPIQVTVRARALRTIPCSDLAYEKRAGMLDKLPCAQFVAKNHASRHLPLTENPVMNEKVIVNEELCSTSSIYQPTTAKKRNLGGAILLAAIDDYRSTDDLRHKDAEEFLYPQTPEGQDHYDWAVGLAEGLNPAWLRDALDRRKRKWDRQRAGTKGAGDPRTIKSNSDSSKETDAMRRGDAMSGFT